MGVSIQVQSVIYNNDKKDLIKAISCAANAARVERGAQHAVSRYSCRYGDASETPVFTPEEVEEIRRQFADALDFEYTFFGFNSGSARGENLLGLDSDADYLVIMNPDVLMQGRFFIEMLQPFAQADVGIVEARQTPVEHPKEYNIQTMETEWATGACFMIRSALFRQLKGFDSDTFFMYCDDVDLSWRVRLAGYKIIYQPLAPVFHAKRLSAKGAWMPSSLEMRDSAKAAMLMAHKWSNPEWLARLLDIYQNSGVPEYQEGARQFLQLQAEGKLPAPIDPEHRVARFLDGLYTEHRFAL